MRKAKYKVGDIIKMSLQKEGFARIKKVFKRQNCLYPMQKEKFVFSYEIKYLFGIPGTMTTPYKEKIEFVGENDIIGKIKETKRKDAGTHLTHCNFGENEGICKYGYHQFGNEECPALREEKIRQKNTFSDFNIKVWFKVPEENEEQAIEILKKKLEETFNSNEFEIV